MNERETAVYALIDIINSGGYNNIVLRKAFDADSSLTAVQKGFVTEVVNGTIRNLIFIDYVINKFSKTRTEKMKPLIVNILRSGVYQIMFMDKVPDSAVCNEAVKIAKKKHFGTLSGFVNAVLRSIAKNAGNIEMPEDKKEYLSVKYSVPMWIIEYWLKYFSYEQTEMICKNSNSKPKVNICVNTLMTDNEGLSEALKNEGFGIDFSDGFAFISGEGSPANTKAFKDGLFYIIDKSSMAAVDALDPQRGESIADICSAPGGKSFYTALKMNNEGRISSRDIYEHKIELINEGRKRLKTDIIDAQIKDARVCFEEDKNKFDRILIDVPCSGLGLMRKKPDIKYTKKYEDIQSLKKLQRDIVSACCEYVKIGGVMVYSTCTVSPEENEENVKWICTLGYEVCDFDVCDGLECIKSKYGVQILTGKSDGFFISKLIRKR